MNPRPRETQLMAAVLLVAALVVVALLGGAIAGELARVASAV